MCKERRPYLLTGLEEGRARSRKVNGGQLKVLFLYTKSEAFDQTNSRKGGDILSCQYN